MNNLLGKRFLMLCIVCPENVGEDASIEGRNKYE